jgi:lysophospholipase L1-like esterase
VKYLCRFAILCFSLALGAGSARAADAFRLVEGDRVVLVGSTLIEREQRYGYWETALTRRYPDKSITFRNLGWSGDTVFGDARAGFETAVEGYRRLTEHVLALKPTVILLGYGTNESFGGPKGLPRFVEGLGKLLDALAPAKARIVLLSPLRQEDLGRPLPDPAAPNKNLRLYADAIRQTAEKRGLLFVDLYDLLGDGAKATPPAPLTDNAIHLTAWGYWRSASLLERGLGLAEPPWRVEIKAKENKADEVEMAAHGARVESVPLCFRVTDAILPMPPQPRDGAPKHFPQQAPRVLRVEGLKPGSYTLTIDGKKIVTAKAEQWAAGVALHRGPEFEQAERLRQAIVAKNRLYFHRWRPQNETYLFGFRKHEQGQNTREVPQFDPLVAAKEKEIAKLRLPAAHTYELRAEKP